jgi:hypothetical protein
LLLDLTSGDNRFKGSESLRPHEVDQVSWPQARTDVAYQHAVGADAWRGWADCCLAAFGGGRLGGAARYFAAMRAIPAAQAA